MQRFFVSTAPEKPRFRSCLTSATMALTLAATPLAQATNGWFDHGYGTINKGMAGAGIAPSQDTIAAATNPAGMAFVIVGNRLDLGVQVFSLRREYAGSGTGAQQSGVFHQEWHLTEPAGTGQGD